MKGRKIAAFFLSMVLLMTAAPLGAFEVSAATSGTTGDCTWTLNGTHLTISGNGKMGSYSRYPYTPTPWGKDITSVTIEPGVTTIGKEAFYACASLSSVSIANSVTDIGEYAFYDCMALSTIYIPGNVSSIGEYSFYNCTSLASVTITNGTTVIGDYAFYDCTSLNSIHLPDSITQIKPQAFENTAYYNNASHWNNQVLYINNHLIKAKETISGEYRLKAGTVTIADYAFYGCKKLTAIHIPDSVYSVGEAAFCNCSLLSSIVLPNHATSLGSDAFYGTAYHNDLSNWSDSLLYIGNHLIKAQNFYTSVSGACTIPEGTLSIAGSAFDDCDKLTSVHLPGSVGAFGEGIFRQCANLSSVTLGYGISNIGKRLFEYCTSLVDVSIPSSVTVIEEGAFANCFALPSITIPNNVTTIESYAFNDCTQLKEINIPDSVTTLGINAFGDCDNLTTATISSNITSMGIGVFSSCSKLTTVNIKNGVTMISDSAFASCYALTTIFIPDSVTIIGESAFYDCKKLTSVSIGKGVNVIKDSAFGKCTSLSSITIPNSVISIGEFAFYQCTNLTAIHLGSNIQSIESYAFKECSNLSDVYYSGDKTSRECIDIGTNSNDNLTDAKWHYNQNTPTTPTNPSIPTTQPTNPTVPTTPTTPTNPTNPDGYVINVYAHIPSLVVGANQSINCAVQIEKAGVVIPSADQFTFAVSDPSKMTVTNIHKADDLQSVEFHINGHQTGQVTLTIQEATTGAVYTNTITITDGIFIYNAEALPKYRYFSDIYNGHINGIYIDSFSTKQKDANTLLVSFDAYNESMLSGVVDVYDANGVLQTTHVLPRHEGNTISGFSDMFKQCYYMIKIIHGGLTEGSALSYRQPFYSQHTPIRDIEVPVGGYIDITNNITHSDTCALVNACELTVNTLLTVGDSLESIVNLNTNEASKKVTKTLFDQVDISDLKNIAKRLRKEVLMPLVQESEKRATADTLSLLCTGTLSTVNFGNIDLESLIVNIIYESGMGAAEELFLDALGGIGTTMKVMFTAVEYAEIAAYILRIVDPPSDNSLRIYFNDANGYLTANDVSISAEDGTSLAAKNFVMHSTIITPNNGLNNAMKSALDDLSDKYVVRDIYLEQNGEIAQPGQMVQVSIPIPDDYDPNNCSIYWVQEDGTLTKINATVDGNYMRFSVNHFSCYAIVEMPDQNNTIVWVGIILVFVILIFIGVVVIILLTQKKRKTT